MGCPPPNLPRATLTPDDQRIFIKCGILLKRSVGEIYEDLKSRWSTGLTNLRRFWTSRKAHAGKYVSEGQNQL